jgi:hypothetical protein
METVKEAECGWKRFMNFVFSSQNSRQMLPRARQHFSCALPDAHGHLGTM